MTSFDHYVCAYLSGRIARAGVHGDDGKLALKPLENVVEISATLAALVCKRVGHETDPTSGICQRCAAHVGLLAEKDALSKAEAEHKALSEKLETTRSANEHLRRELAKEPPLPGANGGPYR